MKGIILAWRPYLLRRQTDIRVRKARELQQDAKVFAYSVNDPLRYGVVDLDSSAPSLSIEAKPESPKSRYAATSPYFFENPVVDIVKSIQPSARGKCEMTTANQRYRERGQLEAETPGRGHGLAEQRYARVYT